EDEEHQPEDPRDGRKLERAHPLMIDERFKHEQSRRRQNHNTAETSPTPARPILGYMNDRPRLFAILAGAALLRRRGDRGRPSTTPRRAGRRRRSSTRSCATTLEAFLVHARESYERGLPRYVE